MNRETILTNGPGGRILTNANVWSADGQWIVFDTRSDPAGTVFDGTTIQAVHVETGELRTLYESKNGAHCGVVTCHPTELKCVCIRGPEFPTAEWSYGPSRRQGIVIGFDGKVQNLDARDLVPPFTPGALRGGTHVHVWHPKGDWVSFTYEDEVRKDGLRNIGIANPNQPVTVPKTHPRNHDGEYFCKLVTRTTANPRIESDEISRACEEAWIGSTRRLAFQGTVHTAAGPVVEVFRVELMSTLLPASRRFMGGTGVPPVTSQEENTSQIHRPTGGTPVPPINRRDAGRSDYNGFAQHRLTRTAHRKFPGIQGPRHWLRSSPDGSKIGCFMKDDRGIVQFWTVNWEGRWDLQQITDSPSPMASAFTWHPDGRRVACIVDGSVCIIDSESGTVTPLTAKGELRPEACVFSPDGSRIAFLRRIAGSNQIGLVEVPC